MTRFPLLAAVWTALLVAGFAFVLALGTPVATSADELNAAMHPATPVSQEGAERSADTIVRLAYPSFVGSARTTTKATDFGVEHWLVEYTDTTGGAPRGVRISIVVATGHVELSAYP
ncbi:MAG: hypothetical protein ACYDAN_11655 [Candidatus Limnocylindrales bacterium]